MSISKEPCSPRLCDLPVGGSAQIQYIDDTSPLCRRMTDLGLRTGAWVCCERRSFLGNPAAYRIGQTGTVIALRHGDAHAVHIREVGDLPWA